MVTHIALKNTSPWDWGQIGIILGRKHVIHQKLAHFTWKKDLFVRRVKRVIFGM